MKAPATLVLFLAGIVAAPCGLVAGTALADLQIGIDARASFSAPAPSAPEALTSLEAVQYLPPNNNEPGFEWPSQRKSGPGGFYIHIGAAQTFLKVNDGSAEGLVEGTGKCRLEARTLYETQSAPVFEGDQIIAVLKNPLPGCAFTRGYVNMPEISSTSAGGLWQLPVNVRAFLDTLAFSEGTNAHYDYIYSYVTFKSYADHPRKVVCSGGLCSSAAGRYQFLTKTWDGLAKDLALTDFTPPSQEKATLELIRRQGAYAAVEKSSDYKNFSKAVGKLNTIWASLPGSPYGQPTHTLKRLWTAYQAALASYR